MATMRAHQATVRSRQDDCTRFNDSTYGYVVSSLRFCGRQGLSLTLNRLLSSSRFRRTSATAVAQGPGRTGRLPSPYHGHGTRIIPWRKYKRMRATKGHTEGSMPSLEGDYWTDNTKTCEIFRTKLDIGLQAVTIVD